MEQNRNRSLAHYGVLGMKWGIRRTLTELATRVSATEKKMRRVKKGKIFADRASRNKTKITELRKKYGDKYSIILNNDGSIKIADGKDTWAIT